MCIMLIFISSLFSFLLFLLRVIFSAHHDSLFSRFLFWNISSCWTPDIILEEKIMFILYFLGKLSSNILLSNLANRKVSQI